MSIPLWFKTKEEATPHETRGRLIIQGGGPHTRAYGIRAVSVMKARQDYRNIPDKLPDAGYILIGGSNSNSSYGFRDSWWLECESGLSLTLIKR